MFRNATNRGELCIVVRTSTTKQQTFAPFLKGCILMDTRYIGISASIYYTVYVFDTSNSHHSGRKCKDCCWCWSVSRKTKRSLHLFPSWVADCNGILQYIIPGTAVRTTHYTVYHIPVRVSRPPTCCVPYFIVCGAESGRGKWRRQDVAWTWFWTERVFAWLRLPMGVRGAGWWRRPGTLRFRCSGCLGRTIGE